MIGLPVREIRPLRRWIASDLLRKVKLDFAVDQLEPSVKSLAGFRFEAF